LQLLKGPVKVQEENVMEKLVRITVSMFLCVWLCVAFYTPANAGEKITLFSAGSTTAPMTEVISVYEKKTGNSVKANFASSGNLARQLAQGAHADIFVSASKAWADYAEEKGCFKPGTRRNILSNSVVLIVPRVGKIKVSFSRDFAFAKAFKGRFAIGNPEHVPAGKYAKQAMTRLGWWEGIEGRLIRTKDVLQALHIVEMGEVELGTVFGSDAAKSDKVEVVGVFPAELHKPIIYVAALCRTASKTSIGFLEFLESETAQDIFARYGFVRK
jgi:molybdate transport system substrate-binding protein